jgi:hypothetical protein
MRLAFMIAISSLASVYTYAGDPYKTYLLNKIYPELKPSVIPSPSPENRDCCFIPRYETPKGAVFCRMEDRLTKATKVWIKIGVH